MKGEMIYSDHFLYQAVNMFIATRGLTPCWTLEELQVSVEAYSDLFSYSPETVKLNITYVSLVTAAEAD